jgi:hypothetical protein
MSTYSEQAVEILRNRIRQLEREVEFLRFHPALSQGLKGERLICDLTEGLVTKLNSSFDLTSKSGLKVEIKFSKLHTPEKAAPNTKRWTWSKPLGWLDKGKDYDYLILVGEKDDRYPQQYLDASPYVAFMIPIGLVPNIATSGRAIGANVNLTTNLRSVRSPASKIIIENMKSMELINELLKTARPLAV